MSSLPSRRVRIEVCPPRCLRNAKAPEHDKISGQLVIQLIFWGVRPIPETDFVIWNKRMVKLHGRGVNRSVPLKRSPFPIAEAIRDVGEKHLCIAMNASKLLRPPMVMHPYSTGRKRATLEQTRCLRPTKQQVQGWTCLLKS
jgi:hypothetical protein